MDVDVWVRRACLAALPALGVAVYLLRSNPPNAAPVPAASATPAAHSSTYSAAASGRARSGEQELGESALKMTRDAGPEAARPSAPSAPVVEHSRSAASLPIADDPFDVNVAARRGSGAANPSSSRLPHIGPCGGLDVRIITKDKDAEWTFASIAAGPLERAEIKRVGERMGNWRVASIEWDRVWVESGGTRCAVGMHAGAREAAVQVGAMAPDKVAGLVELGEAPPWYLPPELAAAIEQVTQTEYLIEKSAVRSIFERGADLLAGLRISPQRAGERVVGIRLDDVKTDSLLDRLGLESGDVVLALNSTSCSSIDSTLDALNTARGAEHLTARLERAGEVFDLTVRVR